MTPQSNDDLELSVYADWLEDEGRSLESQWVRESLSESTRKWEWQYRRRGVGSGVGSGGIGGGVGVGGGVGGGGGIIVTGHHTSCAASETSRTTCSTTNASRGKVTTGSDSNQTRSLNGD